MRNLDILAGLLRRPVRLWWPSRAARGARLRGLARALQASSGTSVWRASPAPRGRTAGARRGGLVARTRSSFRNRRGAAAARAEGNTFAGPRRTVARATEGRPAAASLAAEREVDLARLFIGDDLDSREPSFDVGKAVPGTGSGAASGSRRRPSRRGAGPAPRSARRERRRIPSSMPATRALAPRAAPAARPGTVSFLQSLRRLGASSRPTHLLAAPAPSAGARPSEERPRRSIADLGPRISPPLSEFTVLLRHKRLTSRIRT